MLGRLVAERLRVDPRAELLAPDVVEIAAEADVFVVNLECCIADGGSPNPVSRSPFFFRAPPVAAEHLARWGVDAVTLANNHALDYGADALLKTLRHLDDAGIAHAGAGVDVVAARATCRLDLVGTSLGIIAVSDHPREYAARPDMPGIAWAPLHARLPAWLLRQIREAHEQHDVMLVAPHWGPNMVDEPVASVRAAAPALLGAGATLVAGHSSHVVHGIQGRVLFSLGDFLDDYAVDPMLRNDLSLLFLVRIGPSGVERVEAVPLKLDYCRTRLADDDDARRLVRTFTRQCERLGTAVRHERGRLVVDVDGTHADARPARRPDAAHP